MKDLTMPAGTTRRNTLVPTRDGDGLIEVLVAGNAPDVVLVPSAP